MGAVPVSGDGSVDTELTERDNLGQDEHKGLRDVVVSEAQGFGSSEEDEKRNHVIIQEINNTSEGAIQVPSGPQNSQLQGTVIHWERFLPIRSLKVLLVENDDSTRHVVSALLRNCSYEVTAVANGIQAWKILEDFTNHIDIVLTEVVMPFISGFGLLCKIMSHKTFKNIPVIMMSSHDSMNLVFKCLSKGAVDFLVKPIRKNELKNLWQHVWRRCHSSSGSGSESGTQSKRYVRSKSNGESETNTGSSDERDNGSVGLSIRDGSDNGSGTQSSWTKRAAEVDSPQPLSPLDQLADAPDSTCAQVIHAKPETFSSAWVHVTETKECQKQDGQTENVAMGRDMEIGLFRDPQSQLEHQHKLPTQPNCKIQDKLSELDSKHLEKEHPEIKSENISGEQRDHAANLVGAIGSCTDQQVESRTIDAPSGLSNSSRIKDKSSNDSRELPSLELTSKRLRGVGDIGTSVHDNHNVLRHSNLSAFSKYNTACSANQAPTGNVGSCSPLDNSSIAMNMETVHNSNSTLPNQQSNESSNNNDMASTTKCVTKKLVPEKAVDVAVSTEKLHAKGPDKPVQVQHRYHHYQHHHHDLQNFPLQPQLDHDDLSLKNTAATPQCGSSNMFGGPVEGNAGNYSVNGSASGSNHGSNGQNGSCNALNAGAANIESDNGVAGNSGIICVSGRSNGNATDEDRLAQREAALTKFRQKRKERCFEKKVRYQSRKRLAEQRPRVRGQFVRQTVSNDNVVEDRQDTVEAEDNSPDNVQ